MRSEESGLSLDAPRVGPRVRLLREQRGLTLEVLANRAQLSHGYLSLLEREKRQPGEAVIRRLASALSVSVSYLMGERHVREAGFHPNLDRLVRILEDPRVGHVVRKDLDDLLASLCVLMESVSRGLTSAHDSGPDAVPANLDKSTSAANLITQLLGSSGPTR